MRCPIPLTSGLVFSTSTNPGLVFGFSIILTPPAPFFWEAYCTAFTIFWYPVQRQRLPEIPQRISSSLGLGFFCNKAYDDINMPGVQKPHCKPCSSLNPSCSGCSAPFDGNPSTVMISPPSACTANTVHDFTLLPFKITVHAPQLLVSQPTCVPVSPSCSRIKCTSSSLGSAGASRSLPLILT